MQGLRITAENVFYCLNLPYQMSDGPQAITRTCFKVQLQVVINQYGRKRLKILNLKCNTFPLSMNIWTEQARRLASELTMKSKRSHWDQTAKQRRGLWSPCGFSIIFCHAASLTLEVYNIKLHVLSKVVENLLLINKQCTFANTILLFKLSV